MSLTTTMTLLFVLISSQGFAAGDAQLNKLKEKFSLPEGNYERTEGPVAGCQGDLVEAKWETDTDNYLFRIGERFIFPKVQQSQFIHPGIEGCDDKTTTALSKHRLKQTLNHDCKIIKNSSVQIQEVTYSEAAKKVFYKFSRTGSRKGSLTCSFKLALKQEYYE